MKNTKLFIVILSGFFLSLIMGLISFITLKKCTDNIGCLLYFSIPLLPGILLNLKGNISIMVSLIFWFLLGSLIGFLVYKVKKKGVTKNK